MSVWLTSDTHWWHRNIITYARRPYLKADGQPDVEAMNEDLVARWNAVVQPNDTVRHLGDIALAPFDRLAAIRRRLNGAIILILGNHDRLTNTQYRKLDIEPRKRDHFWTPHGHVLLTHNVMWVQDKLPTYDLVFCGHVHELWRERVVKGKRCINVGVDVRSFRPVTLEELVNG